MREVFDIINRQTRRKRISISIICFLLGFLLVTQIRGQLAAEKPLQEESEKDLVEMTRSLNDEVKSLKAESADLKLQLFKVQKSAEDKKSILSEAEKAKKNMLVLAGTAPVEGRGIEVIVNDDKDELSGTDLAELVNELRAAGADAMAVNGDRIVASTSFSRVDKQMYIGSKKLSKPYVFKAIGDPDVMAQALTMAGGIRDVLTSSVPGVSFDIKSVARLTVPAAEGAKFKYSRSVSG